MEGAREGTFQKAYNDKPYFIAVKNCSFKKAKRA